VFEDHERVLQADAPRCAVMVASNAPKLTPARVKLRPTELSALYARMLEIDGASKVMKLLNVPDKLETTAASVCPAPAG
jgi:hypothetical protein